MMTEWAVGQASGVAGPDGEHVCGECGASLPSDPTDEQLLRDRCESCGALDPEAVPAAGTAGERSVTTRPQRYARNIVWRLIDDYKRDGRADARRSSSPDDHDGVIAELERIQHWCSHPDSEPQHPRGSIPAPSSDPSSARGHGAPRRHAIPAAHAITLAGQYLASCNINELGHSAARVACDLTQDEASKLMVGPGLALSLAPHVKEHCAAAVKAQLPPCYAEPGSQAWNDWANAQTGDVEVEALAAAPAGCLDLSSLLGQSPALDES